MEEHDKIELRSDDVQEILGTPPSWIIRWGTTFILTGVLILFLVSWVVKYPDVIRAPIVITTANPPVPVVARSTGYLQKLTVKDGDIVAASDLLVVLQNPSTYEDVLALEKNIAQLDSLTPAAISAFQPDVSLNLGELQLNYSAFVQILKEFKFKKEENFSGQSISQIGEQIRNKEKLIRTEKDKITISQKNVELAEKRFTDKQLLYTQKVISRNELEDAKKEVYRYEQDTKTYKGRVEELNGEILALQKNSLEVSQTSKESSTLNYVSLVESINQVKTAIAKWKLTYLIEAPVAGKVSFYNNYWSENQNVKEGAEVMAIVPDATNDIVGIVSLPTMGSGKVKEGQRVVIKFDSYPFQQHGVVEGIVASKALLPMENKTISLRVNLPKGLKTSHLEQIKFDQQMQGGAEIITEERRFIERLFDKLITAIKF
jgi:multidrug resistance efflux pump